MVVVMVAECFFHSCDKPSATIFHCATLTYHKDLIGLALQLADFRLVGVNYSVFFCCMLLHKS